MSRFSKPRAGWHFEKRNEADDVEYFTRYLAWGKSFLYVAALTELVIRLRAAEENIEQFISPSPTEAEGAED